MATFTLPTLSRSEIISIFSEFQIANISDSDLLNPNPTLVFDLYSSLLLHLNLLQDDGSQVDFAALERFDNPDMHSDSVRAINLFNKIKDTLECIECPLSFTFNDLISPDSNRTLKFLSAFLNFLLHRESKLSMLSSYAEQIDALEEQCKQKDSKILQLREEIAAINEARDREKPLVLEAESKVKELRQTLDNLNSCQSKLRMERQTMKDKAQELTNNVSKAEFELIQATEENAILRSKIVQSPDKLQRTLEEKKGILMEAKDSERLAMQRFEEKAATLEVYTKVWQKMTKHLAQMQTTQEQVNSAKAVEKDVKQLKAKFSDEEMLEKSLEAKLAEGQAKVEHSDQQKHQLEKEAKLRREEDTRELNNVKLEAESRRHDLEARGRNIEAVIAEADAIKAKINMVKEQATATQLELLKKSEEVANEFISAAGNLAKEAGPG